MAKSKTAIPDDFDPEPTLPTGGIARMLRLWEACRDVNAGGYGSGVVQTVRGWGKPSPSQVTSCSPFTATVIGMMFDARGGEDPSTTYEPKYDNGQTALPSAFYAMHNGFYFCKGPVGDARRKQFRDHGWKLCDDSARSIVFWNLGYQIDPRDMRRGDFVAIDWANKGGHATFCWDVHLDDQGAVDCFLYLSSNGYAKTGGGYSGVGVSVGSKQPGLWVGGSPGSYKKTRAMFADHKDHTEHGSWLCLPGIDRAKVKRETFKEASPSIKNLVDASAGGHAVASLRVVRFWGVAPPDAPHGDFLGDKAGQAHSLTKEPAPGPYAMGQSTPSEGRIENVSAKPVPKSHPEPVKAVPPAPAKQKPAQVTSHQNFVESALAELHTAGWIDKSPGKPDSVADGETKAAIKDFQTKLDVVPIDGIAGPITRKALRRALDDLHAGKRPPNHKGKPVIDRFYWLTNRIDPGGVSGLAVHGQHLDLVDTFEIMLTDQTGRAQKLPVPIVVINGRGVQPVPVPASFAAGSVLTARLSGTAAGARIDKASDVPLYVGKVATPAEGDWPWDESKWPPKMQRIVAELRAAPRGRGDFHTREITQYGVKEKVRPGDVAVLDKSGRELGRVDKRSLFLADIEGTMRLSGRILNIVSSGNVYDQQVTKMIGGVAVKKPKPSLDRFDPARSRWVDVTERAPWGAGARMALIPFRVLAHNPKTETPLYNRIVYIQQLDGLRLPTSEVHNGMCVVGDCGGMAPAGAQFDFFVGREDRHIQIPTLAASQGGAVCRVEILGDCAAAHNKGP